VGGGGVSQWWTSGVEDRAMDGSPQRGGELDRPVEEWSEEQGAGDYPLRGQRLFM